MKKLETKIEKCTICKSNSKISDYILSVKPTCYVGSQNPKVMLIGHSPAVRTSEPATVVLKLDRETQPLFRYINEKILFPLRIEMSEVYATNLIKCQTSSLPEDIKKNIVFFDRCFAHCKNLLEDEIEQIKPELIISLSETVLTILSLEYMGRKLNMKDSFAQLLKLSINERTYNYIPLVHIPKGYNSVVGRHYFPKQTERLEKITWR
jgi:uracil-DNA glycosylase